MLLVAYLRRDTTGEFLAARQSIAETRVEASWTTDSARIERLAFVADDGRRVNRAFVRTPLRPSGEARTLVVYAGKETGEQILRLIPEWPDLTLVAPLYPDLEPQSAADRLLLPAALRQAVFVTVATGMAALDHLDAQYRRAERRDRGRTVALAASLGTSFGTIHTVLDERIDELVIVHGGGDFPTVLRNIQQRRGRPVRAAVLPWVAEALIDTYDPVHWIERIEPRPLLMIATRQDRHFPVSSVEAVYDAAAEPKRIVWTETEHVGAAKAGIVESIMVEVDRYLQSASAYDELRE